MSGNPRQVYTPHPANVVYQPRRMVVSKRVCAEPGCPTLVDVGTRDGRCSTHRRARDKARGTRQQRGYDAAHDGLRAQWQRRLDAGEVVHCWRCGKAIDPNDWTLGHCDDDRTRYHGPECPPCDYATAGRAGCPHPTHPRHTIHEIPPGTTPSRR